MPHELQACVFDAYGTLFDVHSPVARVADALGVHAESISRMWRDKQLQYTWLRSLMGAHADFAQVTADALDYALSAHGVDEPALRDRLLALYMTLDAYPDARPCLAALNRRGLATAILSNGSPAMLKAATQTAGLADELDAILSVEEVGIYKPHPRVYQLAVERLDVPAAAICFVSTNAWDASGAGHFGFSAVRLDRFGLPAERLPGAIAATITTLDELPNLIT